MVDAPPLPSSLCSVRRRNGGRETTKKKHTRNDDGAAADGWVKLELSWGSNRRFFRGPRRGDVTPKMLKIRKNPTPAPTSERGIRNFSAYITLEQARGWGGTSSTVCCWLRVCMVTTTTQNAAAVALCASPAPPSWICSTIPPGTSPSLVVFPSEHPYPVHTFLFRFTSW